MKWIPIPTTSGPATPRTSLLLHELFWCAFQGSTFRVRTSDTWSRRRMLRLVGEHAKLRVCSAASRVPIGFHGDGAAFSHHVSLYSLTWNSLLGVGSTVQKRSLFYGDQDVKHNPRKA